MTHPQLRTADDFYPGEARAGITWLCAFAAMAALAQIGSLEVAYGLVSILLAAAFNAVLSRTACLWTGNRAVALMPTLIWIACFAALYFGVAVTRDILDTYNVRAIALLSAGCIGGYWPVARRTAKNLDKRSVGHR